MKIYTKLGDKGKTSIIKKRVFKDHDLLETLGTVDEVMSYMMVCSHEIDDIITKDVLQKLAKTLFKVNQDLIVGSSLITLEDTTNLEIQIDALSKKLTPLTDFILPGDSKESSKIHFLRTITRRLERRMVHNYKKHKFNKELLSYINRLSDYLFVLARYLDEA